MNDQTPASFPDSSPSTSVPAPQAEKPSLLRTGLIVAGSALFGGIAVALWNRHTLARMRQSPVIDETATIQPPADRSDDDGSTLD